MCIERIKVASRTTKQLVHHLFVKQNGMILEKMRLEMNWHIILQLQMNLKEGIYLKEW